MAMKEPFDIFIPCAPKDYGKLAYLVSCIRRNLSGWDKIYVCSPDNSAAHDIYGGIVRDDMIFLSDSDALELDISRFKHRPNWIYQQYMKLFQNITESDLYFTIDADVIINRPIDLFNEAGQRIIWMGWEQNHRPYFEFQERMLGLHRAYPHTFINDTNFFSKAIIREMLQRSGYTVDSFIEKSFDVIGPDCYPGEPEIFGQYVYKHHPEKYEFRQAKTTRWAKEITKAGWTHSAWTDDEIRAKIEEVKDQDIDFFMLHSWFTTNEVQAA